jgi:hypothetical protein
LERAGRIRQGPLDFLPPLFPHKKRGQVNTFFIGYDFPVSNQGRNFIGNHGLETGKFLLRIKQFVAQADQGRLFNITVPFVCRLAQGKEKSGSSPPGVLLGNTHGQGDPVSALKADAPDILGQPVRVCPDNLQGVGSLCFKDLAGLFSAFPRTCRMVTVSGDRLMVPDFSWQNIHKPYGYAPDSGAGNVLCFRLL